MGDSLAEIKTPEVDESNSIEDQKKLQEEYKETTGESEKKKRGRKPKEVKAEEENNQLFGSTVSKLGTYSFGLLLSRLYPDQPLTTEEEKSLNEAVEAVAVKYVGIVGQYKEEAGLALALGFIFLPRYLSNQEKKKKQTLENIEEKIPD